IEEPGEAIHEGRNERAGVIRSGRGEALEIDAGREHGAGPGEDDRAGLRHLRERRPQRSQQLGIKGVGAAVAHAQHRDRAAVLANDHARYLMGATTTSVGLPARKCSTLTTARSSPSRTTSGTAGMGSSAASGSWWKTSRPAPRIFRSRRAAVSASRSTRAPRPVLT